MALPRRTSPRRAASLRSPLSALALGLLACAGCHAAPPRLQPSDLGLLEARLDAGRSDGSVEDARLALGSMAGDEAWSDMERTRLVVRVRTDQVLDLASLFDRPVEARDLRLDALARLQSESVRLERNGQALELAPGLGARESSSSELATWLSMTIERDGQGRLRVVALEPIPEPTSPANAPR